MNVLMINGSPRMDGNTSIALKEMEKVFKKKVSRRPSFRSAQKRSAAASLAENVMKAASAYLMSGQ